MRMTMTKEQWARRQLYHIAVSRIYANGHVGENELRATMQSCFTPTQTDYHERIRDWMTDPIGCQWFVLYDDCDGRQYALNFERIAINAPYPTELTIMGDINQYFSRI